MANTELRIDKNTGEFELKNTYDIGEAMRIAKKYQKQPMADVRGTNTPVVWGISHLKSGTMICTLSQQSTHVTLEIWGNM